MPTDLAATIDLHGTSSPSASWQGGICLLTCQGPLRHRIKQLDGRQSKSGGYDHCVRTGHTACQASHFERRTQQCARCNELLEMMHAAVEVSCQRVTAEATCQPV